MNVNMGRFWGVYFSYMLVYFIIMIIIIIILKKTGFDKGEWKFVKISVFATIPIFLFFYLWLDSTISLKAKIVDTLIAASGIGAGITYFYLWFTAKYRTKNY
jgi:hypothetical protein